MNSPIDHDDIKSLAKELGRPAKTLIALSENNDPFYIGPQRQIMAEWFADLWDRLDISAGVHIRRIHYVVVSQAESVRMPDAKAYENTFACWCELKDASRDARYLGLVPIEAFVDRRNDEPIINLTAGNEAEIGISDDSLEAVWLPEGLPELPRLTL